MSDKTALQKILEKGVSETTSLEHAVQILFLNEATKGKPLANEAAAELADLMASMEIYHATLRKTEIELARKDAALEAARKLVDVWRVYPEALDRDGLVMAGTYETCSAQLELALAASREQG